MWFLDNVWILPALMGLSFLSILLFGKRFPRKGHEIGIFFVAIAFVLSLFTAGSWISRVNDDGHHAAFADVPAHCSGVAAHHEAAAAGGEHAAAADDGHGAATRPVVNCATWFDSGQGSVTIGTMVDGQSVMMLVVVTLISLLVHIFSTDYVHGDRRYTHYFAFLSLFTASMLFFVLAENTLQMIVGWELVGVCSFALIGHWWEEKPNSDAALKAFLTNRVGDVGLLIGMIILYFAADRSFSVLDINVLAASGEIGRGLLLAASLCLIAAVMSKSGQFILHTWLPDAMAGPTPVSALIHAATMVVAGIYMVARLYPVFFEGLSISGSSINALALVGAVTALFGALLAFVQSDIKKVLAYSTVSQLGFMVTSLGMGAWTAAMFHLFTHAFFKACLFLGAGSLSHAANHSFDMVNDMGGLKKVMPITYRTYVIATLALAGIFPFAGFWSKDEILAGSGAFPGTEGANGTYTLMLVMLLLGAFCTAAYMTRTIWYAFEGEYRGKGHPHESGPRITVPLVILAVFAVIAGVFNLPWDVPVIGAHAFQTYVEPIGAYFPSLSHAEFHPVLAVVSLVVALAGIGAAYLYYWKGALAPLQGLAERNRLAAWGKNVLVNKYYFDWLYTTVITGFIKGPLARAANWTNQHIIDGIVNGVGRGAATTGRWVYDNVDQTVVDGAVNTSGVTASAAGGVLRVLQSGRVQQYAALFFAAVAVLTGVFVVVIG
ncbi:MAG: NADH-quinone oxidoreductase subunit L [Propioniciclava sp.]|nr:NADH-quinone oxidoreductase subunit L [Propioniciclava sp.]